MNLKQFVLLIRVHSFSATIVPLVIGAALSLQAGSFDAVLWADLFVAALFMQIATNVFNEHGDYVNNTDRFVSHGFAGVIVKGEATANQVLFIALTFYILAAILAVPLILIRGILILILGIIAATIGIVYSEGPYPISRTPLAEMSVGITMGLIEIIAAELVSSGELTFSAYVLSVPVSLLVANILIGNNIRDIVKDKGAGRRTLVVILGAKYSKLLFYSITIFSYAWLFAIYDYTSRSSVLLTYLTLPFSIWGLALLHSKGWKYGVEIASLIYLVYGIAVAITLLI
ncbi:MAG: prenyltransferase [Thermoplasmata archaeon]